MFHVVAMGAAVEHETVADDLHEFRVQFFSQSLACLMAFSLRSFLPTWMSGLSLVARPRSCLTCFLVNAITCSIPIYDACSRVA